MSNHQTKNSSGASKSKQTRKQSQERSHSRKDHAVLADINQDAKKTKEQGKS